MFVPSGYWVMYGITVAVAVSVVTLTSTGKLSTVSCTLTVHGAQVKFVVKGAYVVVSVLPFE